MIHHLLRISTAYRKSLGSAARNRSSRSRNGFAFANACLLKYGNWSTSGPHFGPSSSMAVKKSWRSFAEWSRCMIRSGFGLGPSPAWQTDRGNFALIRKSSGVRSAQLLTMVRDGTR